MSQDNVGIVRSGYERFNAGEKEPPRDLWHLDGDYVPDRGDPDPGTHHGLAAITKVYSRWAEAYPDLRVEPLEVRANGDRVFAWVRFSGHGASSGVAIDMERAQVWTVEDSKIRRCEEFFDRSDALEAVGLSE
jgi:ketosteroid isomerase-like protein